MNNLAFLSILVFAILRFTGGIVSLDFLLRIDDRAGIKYFFLGWLCWIFASVFTIASMIAEEIAFKLQMVIFHDIMILLGSFFMIIAVLSYFKQISREKVILGTVAISILPLVIFGLYDYDLTELFLVLQYAVLFIFLIINVYSERKNMRLYISNSVKWFYITIFFSFLYATSLLLLNIAGEYTNLTLIEDNNLLLAYSLLSMTVTLLVFVLTIHLEYGLTNMQKFRMKDKYSHDLGNILQMILNSAEAAKTGQLQAGNEQLFNDLVIQKCHEASFLITEIREL